VGGGDKLRDRLKPTSVSAWSRCVIAYALDSRQADNSTMEEACSLALLTRAASCQLERNMNTSVLMCLPHCKLCLHSCLPTLTRWPLMQK
jgi:hypothetical protein